MEELKEKTDNFGSKALVDEGPYGKVAAVKSLDFITVLYPVMQWKQIVELLDRKREVVFGQRLDDDNKNTKKKNKVMFKGEVTIHYIYDKGNFLTD